MRVITQIRRSFSAVVLCVSLSVTARGSAPSGDSYQSVNDTWDQFGAVYVRVLEHYYQDLDHAHLMRAAIGGMLGGLDSYSQFYVAEGVRQLRQDTTGKFAGLGITVGIKDHYPVVISPMEGTPADRVGLRPGDLIVTIEGADAFGMSLEEVVNVLRGEPGTEVRIGISRLGELSRFDVLIERETIVIKSVAVSGQISPGVGYISMRQTRFSEETSAEVESALKDLLAQGVSSLILDLRGNPGGLLSQATQVADLFLPVGDPIVSIRPRSGGPEEMRRSQRKPMAGELPLVVMIDGGSASAAEIVAGAIQDNDRGLVVGTTSFGKGSVQTIFDLRDQESTALKLTTALYYTPSGRSIHRQSVARSRGLLLRVPFGDAEIPAGLLLAIIAAAKNSETAAAQLRARFELEEAEVGQILATSLGDFVGSSTAGQPQRLSLEEPFQTRNGRQVHGGGGIAPDISVEADLAPAYVRQLRRRRVFFDFVVDYVGKRGKRGDDLEEIVVDEPMLDAFREFAPGAQPVDRSGDQQLAALRRVADEGGWPSEALSAIDSLESILRRPGAGGSRISAPMVPYVRAGLKRELALRLDGRQASLMTELETDTQVRRAVEIVMSEARYHELLKGG